MTSRYRIFGLFTLFATLVWSQNSGDDQIDPRGPCGPCFIDASAIRVYYWVTETITVTGYITSTRSLEFSSETVTQRTLYEDDCTSTQELDPRAVQTADPNDANIQRNAFTTVVGDSVFYDISTIGLSTTANGTDSITATGTTLVSPTAYLAYTSVDVYPEAPGFRGADGRLTCSPRTSYPLIINPTIYVAAPTTNYGSITTIGPQPLATSLVQLLQAEPSILQAHPELASCGAGLQQGAPFAIVPIAATQTVTPSCSAATSVGPKETKGVGNFLVPALSPTGPYVPPTQRIFAVQANAPTGGGGTPNSQPPNTETTQPAGSTADTTQGQPTGNNQQPAPTGGSAASGSGSVAAAGAANTQVTMPEGVTVTDVGSSVTLTMGTSTISGVIVSASGSVVALSTEGSTPATTTSGGGGAGVSTTPAQITGAASTVKRLNALVVRLSLLAVVVFGNF